MTGVCQQLDLGPSSSAAEEKRQPGSIAALTGVPASSRQSSLALVLQAPVPRTWIVVLFRREWQAASVRFRGFLFGAWDLYEVASREAMSVIFNKKRPGSPGRVIP